MSFSDVIVVFGGNSSERRVSVASGQHVLSVLDGAAAWFESPDGRIFVCGREEIAAFARPFENDFKPAGAATFDSLAHALDAAGRGKAFFLGFHGTGGEDGTAQRLFEERGIAFTASGSQASATAFDKRKTKRTVEAAGVRCAAELALPLEDEGAIARGLSELFNKHGRVVAKPVAGGSSVGLHHLRALTDIPRAAAAIASTGEAYLAEEFIAGRELTVGVVESASSGASSESTHSHLRALPCSEVRLDDGRAFDFEGKYLGKGTTEITPAEVPPEVAKAAQQVALAAHRALGCRGYTRTDLILGNSGPVFLETNTLPGLTRASFIPQQLAAEGTSMRAFLEGQLAIARGRYT
ncbi:MAG: ATP-grasp domain-containing protein [Deltaproteobacteria bacterium]|nr:ATP-grasp domain-containing protein [Deltaproteobacteria bacterium]